ncbi:MAG: methionyl-tRNA formyltransferase [Bacteroidetes bacterium HGW-Bacteroidetes-22]|nr:MAG: methionyl-tRNA formyltransferase [Bacteroidetes bacterium HGW-Bacteroidetes-22]
MKRSDLRIVYMGTPEFAVAPLDALSKAGFVISAVVTVADKPAGRGRQLQYSPVKEWAISKNVPFLQPVSLKNEVFLKDLAAIDADLFVVVAFRMLPAVVWKMPRLGTFNLHASLLPMYRGAAPINHAVMNGEKFSGITTFLLDEQLDTGRILFQESMPVGQNETAGDLHDRMMIAGAEMVIKTCDALASGNITPIAQKYLPGSDLKEAPKIFKEDCRIDWNRKGELIRNQIRGLSPYPAAFTDLLLPGEQQASLKIFMAHFESGNIDKTGDIHTDGKTCLAFSCADGWIFADEVQLSGRKRMKIADFLRGFLIDSTVKVDGFSSI